MKHFIVMIMVAIMAVMNAGNIYADNAKDLNKALKKERAAKMKEYKKGKWELFGSSRTLDVALLKHYNMLDVAGEDTQEIVGTCTKCKSKNVGKQMAVNNACIQYAAQAGSSLKGRIVADMVGDASDGVNEFDHFYGAYERLVQKEIKNEMKESFTIIRSNNDGTYEMMVFFIVSESAATKARIRAMENALKESEAAQKHAEAISKFVKEGFEN